MVLDIKDENYLKGAEQSEASYREMKVYYSKSKNHIILVPIGDNNNV